MKTKRLLFKIRLLIVFFIIALMISGITAFPVYSELQWILSHNIFSTQSETGKWLKKVFEGVAAAQEKFPFLFYGFDWLAFAHIMIGLLFIGPYKNPAKNIWVIEWGMIACLAIVPLAFTAGNMRGIPLFHILIDCSFGIIGIIPLLICRKWIHQLEKDKQVLS